MVASLWLGFRLYSPPQYIPPRSFGSRILDTNSNLRGICRDPSASKPIESPHEYFSVATIFK